MTSDLLTTVLRDTGLSRRLLDLSTLSDAVALRFPCERSIGVHVVLRGPVHLHAPSEEQPLALASGDVAVMARGCDHVLSTVPDVAGRAIERIDVRTPPRDAGDHASCVLSGAYQFWHAPLHPLFAEIPAWTVLRASDLPRLGPLALAGGLLAEELRSAGPGADIVMHGLLDAVFTYALRHVIERSAANRSGWSHALHDPQIGRVVALMHDDPAQAWTLDALAKRVGLSRTALAERFRDAIGDTPLNHLRTLRMQRAIKLLADTDDKLEAIAAAVGYRDAFTFSKVFKRSVGMSPKTFRQKDAEERRDPWRFGAR